jgi:hypothetical protein
MADLYSLQGQEPEPLPEKVRLLDSGLTIRVTENIDQDTLSKCGYTGPHEPKTDFDHNTHKCVWSPEDLAFIVVEKSSIEMRNAINSAWAQLRVDRDAQLAVSDGKIMPWLEKGQPAPEAWQRYRQALRDLPANTEDPFRIPWPREPFPGEVEASAEEKKEEPKPRTRRRKTA